MEEIPATRMTIHVSTRDARTHFNAERYTGAISSVSVYVASNVVVGSGPGIVIYSSGSITFSDGTTQNTAPGGAVVSSQVVAGAFSISNNTTYTNVTAMVSTVTVSGSDIVVRVEIDCGWGRTGGSFAADLDQRVLMDNGNAVTLATLDGVVNGQALTDYSLRGGGTTFFTGVSAGSHVFQYQVKTAAQTDTWLVQASKCRMMVHTL